MVKSSENNNAGVGIISIATVQAASGKNESIGRIELTPWDLRLLLLDPIQKGLLFYKPRQENLVSHLRASLSRTLDFFPPLAGRLVVTQNDEEDGAISYSIDCNDAGALFLHATANDLTVSDIIKPLYVPEFVDSFFSRNVMQNDDRTSQPLLAVQVTELADGIFIGCTISHAVVDGTSFWHFFNSWSEISRGFQQPTKPPVFERWFPPGIEFPLIIPKNTVQVFSQKRVSISTPKRERIFHFPKESIRKLKEKANFDINENPSSNSNPVSSLQALLAHLWRSVIRNTRNLEPSQELTYRLIIGLRQRLKPHIPESYFGNAIQPGYVAMKVDELLEKRVGDVAWELNKMVASHTEEKFMSFLRSWVENPYMTMPTSSVDVTISSSPRFDAYGNDFGWGTPVAVRSGAANKGFGGVLTLYPGREDGSIDVEVCVQSEIMEGMEADSEFMEVIIN